MAQSFPNIETIKKLNPYPTDWELTLIDFFEKNSNLINCK